MSDDPLAQRIDALIGRQEGPRAKGEVPVLTQIVSDDRAPRGGVTDDQRAVGRHEHDRGRGRPVLPQREELSRLLSVTKDGGCGERRAEVDPQPVTHARLQAKRSHVKTSHDRQTLRNIPLGRKMT